MRLSYVILIFGCCLGRTFSLFVSKPLFFYKIYQVLNFVFSSIFIRLSRLLDTFVKCSTECPMSSQSRNYESTNIIFQFTCNSFNSLVEFFDLFCSRSGFLHFPVFIVPFPIFNYLFIFTGCFGFHPIKINRLFYLFEDRSDYLSFCLYLLLVFSLYWCLNIISKNLIFLQCFSMFVFLDF